MNRRQLLGNAAALGLLAAASVRLAGGPSCWVYFGTSTTGPGHGIYVADLDLESGALSKARLAAEASNPVFLALAPNHRFLYALGDKPGPDKTTVGEVKAYSVDPETGMLTLVNERPTDGPEPSHINVDPTGRCLSTAIYNGGYLQVYRILPDGSIGDRTGFDQHEGSGPNPDRQKAPHVHSVNFDATGRFAIVADLGLDKVFVYRLDPASGALKPNDPPWVRVKPGAGPRHFAFHPSGKFAYVVNEIDSTVTAFAWDGNRGTLSVLQTVPLLAPGFAGQSTAAEVVVHRSGRFLYASNRGEDSLVAFAIDNATGRLTFVQRMAEGIKYPRNFAIDPTGRWLVCANRDADNAVVFAIDPATGRLSATGRSVAVPQAICVRFLAR